ncbi:hypothetical protein HNY73_007743 [Argiope bruennichi]|uniref:Integrase catalytic domain-containing protein n=1 Tax=Argiope bruennichi TaxID=94029 RepID=A0A8T0FM27_ARGBR|nr:hypothetical protein HNY73_007743 [Argiope bruennichi]
MMATNTSSLSRIILPSGPRLTRSLIKKLQQLPKYCCRTGFPRYGTPLQMHSDQGRSFTSAVFKGLCVLLKIDKTQTTSLFIPSQTAWLRDLIETILNHLSYPRFHESTRLGSEASYVPACLSKCRHETTGSLLPDALRS